MRSAVGLALFAFLVAGNATAQEASPPPEGRFRGGVNLFGGAGLSAGITGAVVGFALRGGWQFNDRFALYAQGETFGWSGHIAAGGTTVKGGIGARLIAMGSYSPVDSVELGIGPSLDGATVLSSGSVLVDRTGTRTSPVGYSGAYFGFHEHFGLRLPLDSEPGRRTGPSFVVDVHSMVSEPAGQLRVATTVTAGLGYEWF